MAESLMTLKSQFCVWDYIDKTAGFVVDAIYRAPEERKCMKKFDKKGKFTGKIKIFQALLCYIQLPTTYTKSLKP